MILGSSAMLDGETSQTQRGWNILEAFIRREMLAALRAAAAKEGGHLI